MPRVRRRPKTRTSYTESHVFALWVGHDFFGVFDRDKDWMRDAWPSLRAEVFALHKQKRRDRQTTHIMPPGWWKWESSELRDESIDEAEQLRRMGMADPLGVAN